MNRKYESIKEKVKKEVYSSKYPPSHVIDMSIKDIYARIRYDSCNGDCVSRNEHAMLIVALEDIKQAMPRYEWVDL